jgi:hypothetical protein
MSAGTARELPDVAIARLLLSRDLMTSQKHIFLDSNGPRLSPVTRRQERKHKGGWLRGGNLHSRQ